MWHEIFHSERAPKQLGDGGTTSLISACRSLYSLSDLLGIVLRLRVLHFCHRCVVTLDVGCPQGSTNCYASVTEADITPRILLTGVGEGEKN